MKTEKNYYLPPVLELEEVKIEKGFATSGDGVEGINFGDNDFSGSDL